MSNEKKNGSDKNIKNEMNASEHSQDIQPQGENKQWAFVPIEDSNDSHMQHQPKNDADDKDNGEDSEENIVGPQDTYNDQSFFQAQVQIIPPCD